MLSTTGGWRKRNETVQLSETDKATTPCPHMAATGRCVLFNEEQNLRRKILQEKADERANKIALLEELGEPVDEAALDAEEGEWQLHVLVAERMKKRCPYLHRSVDVVKPGAAEDAPQRTTESGPLYRAMSRLLDRGSILVEKQAILTVDDVEDDNDVNALVGSLKLNIHDGEGAADFSRLPKLLSILHKSAHQQRQVKKGDARPAIPWKWGDGSEPTEQEVRSFLNAAPQEQSVDFTASESCVDVLVALRDKQEAIGAPLMSLRMQRCNMLRAETLVSVLKKLNLATSIVFLDLAHNELDSMRLLFHLKSTFPALLSLRLHDNPITRKPDYQEQVKRTLESLALLDGVRIRSPPLALPYPKHPPPPENAALYDDVLKFLTRFFNTWEAREFRNLPFEDDLTDFSKMFYHKWSTFTMSVHEECVWFDEATMGRSTREVSADEQAALETLGGPEGVSVLNPLDKRELKVLHVLAHNSSRNIILGKAAVHKVARGPLPVASMSLQSLYPQLFITDHHLSEAIIDIQEMVDPFVKSEEAPKTGKKVKKTGPVEAGPSKPIQLMAPAPKANKKKQKEAGKKRRKGEADQEDAREQADPPVAHPSPLPVFGAAGGKPSYIIVTIHGFMSWRGGSMTNGRCIRMAVDRTLTLMPFEASADPESFAAASRRRRWKREAKEAGYQLEDVEPPKYLVANDQVTLRPLVVRPKKLANAVAASASSIASAKQKPTTTPVFEPRDPRRAGRAAAMYGLRADDPLAIAAMERCNSDKALHDFLAWATAPEGARTEGEGSSAPAPSSTVEEEEEAPAMMREKSFTVSGVAPVAEDGASGVPNDQRDRELSLLDVHRSISSLNRETSLLGAISGQPKRQ